ncbi:hypothetical protein RND71_034972 [Anisodus tanguticus]|uniref:Uncharacterized protein n=1 Tax=Anisodus tanguticus TaxID=243964 RepID=A0AAE1R4L3_9SOLA|nr:hypothetical protein RND71_034972 [Anisodus tanguticus]
MTSLSSNLQQKIPRSAIKAMHLIRAMKSVRGVVLMTKKSLPKKQASTLPKTTEPSLWGG